MSPQDLIGKIEYFDFSSVKGWALNRSYPDQPVSISVLDGETKIDELSPSLFCWELKQKGYGMGYHGFVYRLPAALLDGKEHNLRFVFDNNGAELDRSPINIKHNPRSLYIPLETTELKGHKVLVLASSPGDESMGSGGSISVHSDAGDSIRTIILTNGVMDDNVASGSSNQTEQVRSALAILGAPDPEFWNVQDITSSNKKIIDKLSDVLTSYKPSLIYCPSPHELSPGRRAAGEILWRAVQKSAINCTIAFTEIGIPIRINTIVDISSVIELKKRACGQYSDTSGNISLSDQSLALNRFRASFDTKGSQYAEGLFLINSTDVLRSSIEKFSKEQFFSSIGTLRQKDLPLVSIIIRTRNREPLLREALSSVVMQNYPNIEVVLVNDGDSDHTELLSEFRKYLDIQYLNPKNNLGVSGAANLGFKAAKGRYVNLLDDDDILYSNHVSKLALFLDTTGKRAAYSDCEIGRYEWDESGFTLKGEKELVHGFEYDQDKIIVSMYIPNMLMMCERKLIEEIGYMDEEFQACEDWELWIRVCLEVSPERLRGVSAEYRFFADHNHDYTKWRKKVYQKNNNYDSNKDLKDDLLNRIDILVRENGYLRRRLAGETVSSDYRPPRRQTMWKILYSIKQFLPEKVVKYIQSKGYKL